MLRLYKDEKKKTPCCHPGGRSTVFENMDSDSNNRTELDGAAKENTLSGKNRVLTGSLTGSRPGIPISCQLTLRITRDQLMPATI